VEGLRCTAVHATQTAGRENPDAGEAREVRRRRDGGRPRTPERREDRQVAQGGLGELVLSDATHAVGIQSDLRHPVEHRDRRGRDALITQQLLELERGLVIARARQPVADDRRFERDDGTAVGERVGDLGGELEGGHPSTLMRSAGTTLPGLKLSPGSTAENSPRMTATPSAEMSCSSHGECSTPTPWWCEIVPPLSTKACWMADFTTSYSASMSSPPTKAKVK